MPFSAARIGRKATGAITGIGGGVLLIVAGLAHLSYIGTVSAFFAFLVAGYLFADGSFTNLVPLSGEMFPAPLRAHAQGLGNAAGGVGKIIGPLVLAIFANTGNLIEPEATSAAALPSFVFFGGCILFTAVIYGFVAPETNKRNLELLNNETVAGTSSSLSKELS